MKIATLILFGFFFLKSCGQESKIDQEALELEYITYSRGGFKSISINNSFIKQKSQRDQEDFISKTYSEKDWEKIISYLEKIDWNTLETLEAPTKKRLFDGALHASLKITYKDKVHQSKSFDHGSPPEEIKSLIEHIIALAESIE